jgi:hypothetical protein
MFPILLAALGEARANLSAEAAADTKEFAVGVANAEEAFADTVKHGRGIEGICLGMRLNLRADGSPDAERARASATIPSTSSR